MENHSDNRKELILIGGGGHCRSAIDVIGLQDRYKIAGIIDLPQKEEDHMLGYPIIGTDEDIPSLAKRYSNFLITLGHLYDPTKRIRIFNTLKSLDLSLPTIISPLAYVSKTSVIGEGTIIMHQAIVNSNVNIGANCIINTKSLIEHDAVVKNHCHISTGAILNGGVIVGGNSFIGSGAVCVQNVKVPQDSFIKAHFLIKE